LLNNNIDPQYYLTRQTKMKCFILFCLLTLSFSSGFRDLQQIPNPAPLPEDNLTIIDPGPQLPPNTTASGQTLRDITSNIDISGTWSVMMTNCTSPPDIEADCTPVISITNDATVTNQVIIGFLYPLLLTCGTVAGQSSMAFVIANGGVWFENSTDIEADNMFKLSIGIYNPHNSLISVIRQDMYNAAGGTCWENWALFTEAPTTPPVNSVSLIGAWQASALSLSTPGAQCCISDTPILITSGDLSNSFKFFWRAPDCPECGNYAKNVVAGTAIEQEQIAIDNMTLPGVPMVLYTTLSGKLRLINPNCVIEFTAITPSTTCLVSGTDNTGNP
jgi:hypothetical protein